MLEVLSKLMVLVHFFNDSVEYSNVVLKLEE